MRKDLSNSQTGDIHCASAIRAVKRRLAHGVLIGGMLFAIMPGVAQSPSETVSGPTEPAKLPLSGRPSPAAPVTLNPQMAPSSGANSVDSIDNTVTVQSPYA